MPMWISPQSFRELAAKLEPFGVKPHPDVARGLAIYDAVSGLNTVPSVRVLDLTPEQAIEHTFDRHRRASDQLGRPGISQHQTNVQDNLLKELQDVVQADVPRILKELRPKFDAAAKAVYTALDLGITSGISAERVLQLEDTRAVDVWRKLPDHLAALGNIARLRMLLSQELGVPPHPEAFATASGPTDFTACFTAPETGVTSGLHVRIPGGTEHVWLALAADTGRRLRLNDPDETVEMIRKARYARA
jgi:hypothetical protein